MTLGVVFNGTFLISDPNVDINLRRTLFPSRLLPINTSVRRTLRDD
jgi:hypothetical protein